MTSWLSQVTYACDNGKLIIPLLWELNYEEIFYSPEKFVDEQKDIEMMAPKMQAILNARMRLPWFGSFGDNFDNNLTALVALLRPTRSGALNRPLVILSYASTQQALAENLLSWLEERGFTVKHQPDGEGDLLSEIAIARAFIPLLSREYLFSEKLANELLNASQNQRKILPLVVDTEFHGALNTPESTDMVTVEMVSQILRDTTTMPEDNFDCDEPLHYTSLLEELSESSPTHVCICYQSSTLPFMKQVREALNAHDIAVWDGTQVPAGQDWRKVSFSTIRNAPVFILVLNKRFLFSIACQAEVHVPLI